MACRSACSDLQYICIMQWLRTHLLNAVYSRLFRFVAYIYEQISNHILVLNHKSLNKRFKYLCEITNHSFYPKSEIKSNHNFRHLVRFEIQKSRSSACWKHLATIFTEKQSENDTECLQLCYLRVFDTLFGLPTGLWLSAKVVQHCVRIRPVHITEL